MVRFAYVTVLFATSLALLAADEVKKPIAAPKSHPLPKDFSAVVSADGKINHKAYTRYATTWTKEALDARLGPSFAQLNPNAVDDRPTNYKPPSKNCDLSFANRTNPYELGVDGCVMDNDYWSDSGQVGYVPQDEVNDPGLDRIQTFAYYNHVFALSPRLDYASGKPHPDPQTQEANYRELLGGKTPQQPIALVRNYGMLQNEALVIYRDGLFAVAGTQTSRAGEDRPYPGFVFPKNKVPTAMAITTSNEFALVTIWDTDTAHGQLAVVALEGKYLPSHTLPYMGMPNEGSFSDLKLLGYVDLPFATPSSVAAATNSWWGGPSQTAGLDLGQLNLKDENFRSGFAKGEPGWVSIFADKGYAIVASKLENKVAFIDLSPLMKYIRESYLSPQAKFDQVLKSRGPKPNQFPLAFSENPSSKPRVVEEKTIEKPSAVLAGLRIDRWSEDHYKGYVAEESGVIHIFDTSTWMARFDWEKTSPFAEIGTVKVGRNPVSMLFIRFGDSTHLPLVPKGNAGNQNVTDPLNNLFYVLCRGEREIQAIVTWGGKGEIYRKIRDSRLDDPVAASVATRGNILSVADFSGKKVVSFRIGGIVDRKGRFYGPGADGKSEWEFAGELPLAGWPFMINSANVN